MAIDKYRLKTDLEGLFHNLSNPRKGDIVLLNDADATRYLKAGYITRRLTGEIPPAYKEES